MITKLFSEATSHSKLQGTQLHDFQIHKTQCSLVLEFSTGEVQLEWHSFRCLLVQQDVDWGACTSMWLETASCEGYVCDV